MSAPTPHRGRGFTLIELMIVIAIIAIIAAIAIPNLLRSRVAGNEQNAAAGLKTLSVVESTWRRGDLDQNGVKDFWTGDLYGMYGIATRSGAPSEQIAIDFAKADANPLSANGDGTAYVAPGPPATPVSKQGYLHAALTTDELGAPYQTQEGTHTSPVTHRTKFAFSAFPETYDGTGVRSFIIDEDGAVYGRDLGTGAAITDWPAADPTSAVPPWFPEGG